MKDKSGLKIYNKNYAEEKLNLYGIFAAGLLCVGMILMLSDAFPSMENGTAVFSVITPVISIGILYLMYLKSVWMVPIAVTAIVILSGILFSGKINSGIAIMGNDFLSFLTATDGNIYLDFATEHPDGVWYVISVVGIIIALLCALSVKKRDLLPVMPLLLISFAGCIRGFIPMGIGTAVMFVGTIFLIIYIIQARRDKNNHAKRLIVQCILIVLSLIIALSTAAIPESVFEKSMLKTMKENTHAEKYHLSDQSMPEGKLDNLGKWDKDASAALRLSMEMPEKMYLKGMTGEVYSGTSWDSLGKDILSEYEDTFYWLHKFGYFSQSSIADAELLTDKETEIYRMQIATIGACRERIYVPYALYGNEVLSDTLIGDNAVYASEETGIYSYQYTLGSVPEWYLAQNALANMQTEENISNYLRHEESYRDFVYKNYLQLTNASVGVLDRVLGSEKKQRTLAEIRKNIFDTLEKHLVYDESVVTKNNGNDFFQYFMEQTKSGYSVHYATAAVLMLRYYGVPARYVEGYFLSAKEAEEYESGETIILDQSHAHAWAEYYLDGVGWIPFEVTPGYVDNEELQLSDNVVSNQQIYDQNELKYTPPIQKEERQPLSDWRNWFAIKKEHVMALILLILAAFIIRAALKRRKLRRKIDEIKKMDNKEAITSVYGYAVLLLGKVKDNKEAENGEVALINREAMFSNHPMTDEQRKVVEDYSEAVKKLCSKNWKWWEKIKYKFIECIYL